MSLRWQYDINRWCFRQQEETFSSNHRGQCGEFARCVRGQEASTPGRPARPLPDPARSKSLSADTSCHGFCGRRIPGLPPICFCCFSGLGRQPGYFPGPSCPAQKQLSAPPHPPSSSAPQLQLDSPSSRPPPKYPHWESSSFLSPASVRPVNARSSWREAIGNKFYLHTHFDK